MTLLIGLGIRERCCRAGRPHPVHGVRRFRRGRPARGHPLPAAQRAGAALHRHRPRQPGPGPRLRPGRPRHRGWRRGQPLPAAQAARGRGLPPTPLGAGAARAGEGARLEGDPAAGAAPAGEPAAVAEARQRAAAHPLARRPGDLATTTTCPTRSTRCVLGPSMTYTCAVLPDRGRHASRRRRRRSTTWSAASSDLQPGMRLLDVGCGWGGMVRHAAKHYGVTALGVTLSEQQAAWAQQGDRRGGARRPRRGAAPATTATCARRGFDAVSSIGLTEHIGVRNYPAYFRFLRDRLRAGGRLLNHCITRPDNRHPGIPRAAFIDRYVFPDGELDRLGPTLVRSMQDARPRGAPRGEPARALRA